MQVSDLTFRLKVFIMGFLFPLFVLLGLLLSAPFWLVSKAPYQKSDLAVLEVGSSFPTKKYLKSVVNLSQKGDFKKLMLVVREDKAENLILSPKEKKEKILSTLINFGFSSENLRAIAIPYSKMGDTEEASKNLLKIAVSENVNSILLLTQEFESKRILGIYKKTLASLPVKVSAHVFPSQFTPSNWFLSDDGLTEVGIEFFRYLFAYIRGIL
ncbi:hypothetical protein P3G55_03800 [Leptospira sp. 96542]|nr:hypothetical protein [Leptospira sp. 96542]